MEKVIREFRVIETDDGFRIEIKGDKEAIRPWLAGFGHWGHRRRHGGMHPFFRFGPRFWGRWADWCGPWWAEETSEEPESKSAAA